MEKKDRETIHKMSVRKNLILCEHALIEICTATFKEHTSCKPCVNEMMWHMNVHVPYWYQVYQMFLLLFN